MGARGNATSFPLPWASLLSELVRLDGAQEGGPFDDLPWNGDQLAEKVSIILKTFDDVEAETIAGLGINGGNPLQWIDWMNALVDQEVAALPESDPAINAIVRDLLVSCRCFVWCTGVFLSLFYSRDDIRSYTTTFHHSLILLLAIIYLIHHRVPGK